MTDVLVTPAALTAELASPAPPLLIDSRPAEQFARGQIAGAVHLDLWGVSLIDTSEAPLRAFMWMIGHLFSLRGVTADRPVVVYEHDSGLRAARAFWLLEYLGHPNVRVLDGGFGSVAAAGASRRAPTPSRPPPATWHGSPNPDRIATWQDVLDAAGTCGDGHRRHAQRGRVPGASRPRASGWRDSRRGPSRVDEEPHAGRPVQAGERSCARCTRRSA